MPAKSGELMLNNHFEGLAFAVKNAAMMVTMTESSDIDTVISNNARIPDIFQEEKVALFIYDRYEGGLGYSEKIYDLVPEILEKAIHMVKGCSCEDGCPACVGDYTLDKAMVLWGLEKSPGGKPSSGTSKNAGTRGQAGNGKGIFVLYPSYTVAGVLSEREGKRGEGGRLFKNHPGDRSGGPYSGTYGEKWILPGLASGRRESQGTGEHPEMACGVPL